MNAEHHLRYIFILLEDAKVYTDEQIKLLRKYDIQDLINLNNSTMNKITAILEDGTITPNEKVQLYAEFKRIKIMYEDIIGLYATVNDSTLEGSLNEMIYYYQQLVNILTPILVDMDVDSSASSSQVREAFNTFYDFYYELLTAIQKAVAVQGQYNYTQLNMLDEKISMTATTVEAYNGKIDEFSSHFDFSQEGFVQIYASHNGVKGDFETQITDQKLAFKEKGQEVAYISNQEMFITKATVTDQMQIGSFIIKPSGTANGGVIFVHEDDL